MTTQDFQFNTVAAPSGAVHSLVERTSVPQPPKPIRSADDAEQEALAEMSELLAELIIDRLKESSSGNTFTVRVEPLIKNFGTVAQLRIIKREKAGSIEASNHAGTILDETSLSSVLLKPAIARGRAGSRPQIVPLRLSLHDDLIVATLTLYVGIKQQA